MGLQFRTWDFEGAWSVGRWIEDRREGRTLQFVGRATFRPEGAETLLYHEDGQMHGPGVDAIRAERRHLWRFAADGIEVEFEDGRPFFGFDPLAARPRAVHDCPPDLYTIALDFDGWPEWRTVWTVAGPRKDMTITSTYRRDVD